MEFKFKPGEKVKIVSKSLNSKLVKSYWNNMIGYIFEVRDNGFLYGYNDDFYYAVSKSKSNINTGSYHFLESDLRSTKNVIKKFNWSEFKI